MRMLVLVRRVRALPRSATLCDAVRRGQGQASRG